MCCVPCVFHPNPRCVFCLCVFFVKTCAGATCCVLSLLVTLQAVQNVTCCGDHLGGAPLIIVGKILVRAEAGSHHTTQAATTPQRNHKVCYDWIQSSHIPALCPRGCSGLALLSKLPCAQHRLPDVPPRCRRHIPHIIAGKVRLVLQRGGGRAGGLGEGA